MKITIIREFDSVEEAVEFLQPYVPPVQQIKIDLPVRESELPETVPAPEKKPRKPRSDAGQPRGPYKPREETAAPAQTVPDAAPAQSAAPAAAAPAPAAPKELTIDDLKAAMTVLSKKHGIEANMKLLAQFGTEKVSALPKDKYAAFHEAVQKAAGVA